jgi:hypothetical protein
MEPIWDRDTLLVYCVNVKSRTLFTVIAGTRCEQRDLTDFANTAETFTASVGFNKQTLI